MEACSNNVQLKNRTLWFDGDSSVNSTELINLLLDGISVADVHVDQLDEQIKLFNKNVPQHQRLDVKQDVRNPVNLNWNIPEYYKHLDVNDYLLDLIEQYCKRRFDYHFTDDSETMPRQVIDCTLRCSYELSLFSKHQLFDVLRTLIYIINTLYEQDVVWGVGRGSGVSSFVLYLIGVHDVDSIKYGLDIHDFITSPEQ